MSAPRYETVATAGTPGSPDSAPVPSRFNKGVVVKMVAALGLVIGAYVCFTLASEQSAVSSSTTAPSFQSYLPSEAPTEEELSFRSVVQQALKAAAPVDAFDLVSHDGVICRCDFDTILSGALHASISEAVNEMPPNSGPFTPFFTTLRQKSKLITINASVVLDRVFAVIDVDTNGNITRTEFEAAVQSWSNPSPALVFAIFDADSDGHLTSEEIDPVLIDAINATMFLAHEFVDVLAAATLEVSPVASTMAVASMSPSFTFSRLWSTIVSMPQFDTRIAPAVAMSFDSPQLSDDFFAHAHQELEDSKTRFTNALGDAEGLDSDAFIAFASQKYVEDWSTNEHVLVALRQAQKAMSAATPAMGPAGALLASAPAAEGEEESDFTVSAPTAELLRAAQAEFNKHPDRMFWPVFQLLDLDRNGMVTMDEFERYQAIATAAMLSEEAMEPVDKVRSVAEAVFNFVDGNGDGEITVPEMKSSIDGMTVFARESIHVFVDVFDVAILPRAVHMASSAMIGIVDTSGDHKASMQEIMAFASNLAAMVDPTSAAAAPKPFP